MRKAIKSLAKLLLYRSSALLSRVVLLKFQWVYFGTASSWWDFKLYAYMPYDGLKDFLSLAPCSCFKPIALGNHPTVTFPTIEYPDIHAFCKH